MKNHWLKNKIEISTNFYFMSHNEILKFVPQVSDRCLTRTIISLRDGVESHLDRRIINNYLISMAIQVYVYLSKQLSIPLEPLDGSDAIEDMVNICWDKMNNYDPNKSKAFYFFTTIMHCHFIQMKKANKWK